jgi:hypothetical protein
MDGSAIAVWMKSPAHHHPISKSLKIDFSSCRNVSVLLVIVIEASKAALTKSKTGKHE